MIVITWPLQRCVYVSGYWYDVLKFNFSPLFHNCQLLIFDAFTVKDRQM